MKILERIKKGLSEFDEALGEDLKTVNYPPEEKAALEASENGPLADMEQDQKQLEESKTTKRSQLANELSVHEDGTIKGLGNKEQEKGNTTKPKITEAKQTRRVGDSERMQ